MLVFINHTHTMELSLLDAILLKLVLYVWLESEALVFIDFGQKMRKSCIALEAVLFFYSAATPFHNAWSYKWLSILQQKPFTRFEGIYLHL